MPDESSDDWAASDQRMTWQAVVHVHEPSDWWLNTGEEPLSGKSIVFQKWTQKSWTLNQREFATIDESDVLAVFEDAAILPEPHAQSMSAAQPAEEGSEE